MKQEIDHTNILLTIRNHSQTFTNSESKIAEVVLAQPSECVYISITELAEKAGVGEATVLRFCRRIGFKGFQDFKLCLAQVLVQPNPSIADIGEEDELQAIIHQTTASLQQILEETRLLLNKDDVEKAVELMAAADRIFFFGAGASGIVAEQAMYSFTRIGKVCQAVRDTHFQAMASALLTERDVAVGISVSGSSMDTVDSVKLAQEAGAKVIAITHNVRSPITKVSDVDLLIAARENPLEGNSMAGKISHLLVIDILCRALSATMKDQAARAKELTSKAVSQKLY